MKRLVALSALLIPFFSISGDLDYAASVEGSYVRIENVDSSGAKADFDTLTLTPQLSLDFTSRRLQARATASNRFVDRHISSDLSLDTFEDNKNSFPQYNFNATGVIIDKVMTVSANASLVYNNSGLSSPLITNQVFRSNQLAKSKRSGGGFAFNLPNPRYVDFSIAGNLDKITTERNDVNDEDAVRLDSENVRYQARFSQGNEIKNVGWNLSASHTDTKGRSNNDIMSKNINGSVYLPVISDLRFVATGQSETNELISRVDPNNSRELNYDSYGAGLSWYKSNSRFIDLTYNVSDERDGEKEKFVGMNFNWQFSARTQASGNIGRRFYGKSANFKLQHSARKLRTSIAYNESLTSYSRLQVGETFAGVFVCPIGATDFTACFQPDSLDYELQVGEEFAPIDFITYEISEEPFIRKSLVMNLGYSFRKISANFQLTNSQLDYVESTREQEALYASLSLKLGLGRKSSITLSNSFSDIQRLSENATETNEKTYLSTLSYNYNISKNLTTKVQVSYADQDSPVENRDFNTKRMTLSFNYKFK